MRRAILFYTPAFLMACGWTVAEIGFAQEPTPRSQSIEWGVNGHPFWSNYTLSITDQLNLIKQLGLTSYRVDIHDSSASTISELSSLVTQATAMGITILPVIGASPSQFSSESAAYSWGVSTGAALAKALPGLTWELGNELDLFSGGNTNMTDPTQYNTTNYDLSRGMISGLYAGIHQADPTSQGMVDIAANDFGFLTRLASDGVHWDITALHWYGNAGNGSNFLATAATFGKPIAVTEFNSLAGSVNGDSAEQSYLSSEMPYLNSVAATYNIKAAYIYELLDQSDMTSTEAHYGLASNTGTLKPASQAVKRFLGAGAPGGSRRSAKLKADRRTLEGRRQRLRPLHPRPVLESLQRDAGSRGRCSGNGLRAGHLRGEL